MNIAQQWAEFSSALTFDELPSEVVDATKNLLLDYLGVSYGGRHLSPSAETFVDGVRALEGTPPDRGDATVVGTGARMSAGYAALLNGALAHSLDFDDTEMGHPGAPVISVALAAGETVDATGEEFLTSVVAGYEVYCRLARAVNTETHYERGFHPTATCGVFGATAAAGTVRRLDATELTNAFGLNASQASGTHGYIRYGGWNKRAHPGIAAHSAIVATRLAEAGFQGTPEPIQGYRNFLHAYTDDPTPEAATEQLGDTYLLPNTGIKPYPCCRGMHTAVFLAVVLAREESISPNQVERITVEVPSPTVRDLAEPEKTKREPETLVQAQFSLPFGVALAVVRGDAGINVFLDEVDGGYSETVQRVIDTVTVRSSPAINAAASDEGTRPARVVIDTDTARYEQTAEHSPGDPQNPLSPAELRAKFTDLTPTLSQTSCEAVIDCVYDLDSGRLSALTELFADSTPSGQ